MNIKEKQFLINGLKAGGATKMWEDIICDALPTMRSLLPEGAKVLEVGYGDGVLSCFAARELGWKICGVDPDKGAYQKASQLAALLNMGDSVKFLRMRSQDYLDMSNINNHFDGVFIKTVLYNSKNICEYKEWLHKIYGALKPGGIFVNFETGKSNRIVQMYRLFRGREYAGWCLYTSAIERLYDEIFDITYRKYYGGISQFFFNLPFVYRLLRNAESRVRTRNADNCFAVAIIGRKRQSTQS